ncbi:hypothetical protein K440DRAFT_223300 [Wilcoxina mikolae CBS 423.85]|nr:hypothetical protein K440DRAFT_223300 [Wilcoxina mikolae CBS 423.85]
MDSRKALPEPLPQIEPASEHTLKAVAIRGTAAILRRLSVTRKQADVDEAVSIHEDLVPKLPTPLSEIEWDGSRRPVTWAHWSPAASRRNSWSGPDQGELLVPEEHNTARRHSVAADEALTAIPTESATRGESNHPPSGDSIRSLQQQLCSFEFTSRQH